ncbi:MAG: 30S ribosomal protein S12 methylthiotransferase RimO [Desulfohalobiaceae bacterium]
MGLNQDTKGRILVHVVSLGCPKNLVDTERMLGCLGEGFEAAQTPEEARVVLINTCGFIRPAVEESVQAILEAAAVVKNVVPKPLLLVTGCLVERYGRELEAELPEVDLWLPISGQQEIGSLLARELRGKESFRSGPRVLSTPPGTAYLKIAEGCDNRCRFCTIPALRGPLASRPVEELRREAAELLARGVKEITLVAQDVTAYGRDLGLKQGLQQLLDALLPLPGLTWLRLLYLYPAGLTSELLVFLKGCGPALLPYFDVPLQHAHPDILSSMGRPFTRDPVGVVERIREYFPECALRTSLMVGYPGETEEHFAALLEFVRRARFHNLGVFTFYPEEGTPAAGLQGHVGQRVKEKRQKAVMELQAEISASILEQEVGLVRRVLVDRPDPEWPTLYQGRTWFQAPEVDGMTYVSGEQIAPGQMVQARIESASTYDLTALAE